MSIEAKNHELDTDPDPIGTDPTPTASDGQPTATDRVEGLRRRMANWAREGVSWMTSKPSDQACWRTLQRSRRRAVKRTSRLPFQDPAK